MKYIVMLGDGMADTPVPALGNRTPLQAAHKPNMDYIAQHGACGLCRTIPEGMPPGSDTANLSVLGYDPRSCYTGRSPLEAVSLGIDLAADDVTFRCNLVTLSDEPDYEDKTMLDYSSGEITTEEAVALIEFLQKEFNSDAAALYPGVSYRHCLVFRHEQTGAALTPPHDITNKPVAGRLPTGRNGEKLLALMKRSHELLKDHPVNKDRVARGLNPANSCWFWGEGTRPKLPLFREAYGLRGGVICAVDLIRGIGRCAGMENLPVEGATGAMWTNFAGKGEAALKLLTERDCDLVYIHVEAPDECGHHGDPEAKVRAIEAIDSDVLGFLMERLRARGEDFSVLLAPDHPTPVDIRTHTADPVPFVLYRSDKDTGPAAPRYTEADCAATGLFLPEGPLLMQKLTKGEY